MDRLTPPGHDLSASQPAELEMIYQTAPVGLCVIDRELRFVRINERMAEMNGVSVAGHIGRTVREVVPGLADEAEPLLRRLLETGEPMSGLRITGHTAAQPGQPRSWIETWAPLRAPDGTIVGINIMAEEVTERERREQLRDAFASILSHELRTPVTAIYGAASLLRRRPNGEDRDSLLADIMDEADRLRRMVEDLLVVSRAEHGSFELTTEPVLLAREIPAIADHVARRFPDLRIHLELPPGLPPVAGDATYIRHIVSNLLTNSGKYARGDVTVAIGQAGEFIQTCVTDTGPGFTADEAEHVFELFYRTNSAAMTAPGSGVGLFVVRALVEAMGGSISLRPVEPHGASFCFTLPIFDE